MTMVQYLPLFSKKVDSQPEWKVPAGKISETSWKSTMYVSIQYLAVYSLTLFSTSSFLSATRSVKEWPSPPSNSYNYPTGPHYGPIPARFGHRAAATSSCNRKWLSDGHKGMSMFCHPAQDASTILAPIVPRLCLPKDVRASGVQRQSNRWDNSQRSRAVSTR